MKAKTSALRPRRAITTLSLLAVLILAASSTYAQAPSSVPPLATEPAPGAAPGSEPVSGRRPTVGQVGGVVSASVSSLPYTTFTYTHSDMLIFSYNDGTSLEVYNAYGGLVWSGILNASQHSALTPGAGVYRVLGSAPYSICVGDEITDFVLGYYAFDQYGRGLSTRLYTYQSYWSSTDYDPHFIVFAYEDGSNVQVVDTQTGIEIWSGTLNAGEHYDNTTLSNRYLTVTSSQPVAALSYTDQGYYVPSENGTFVGIRFYTYVGNAGAWGHSLNIVAYQDATSVEVRYTSTGSLIWSGVLDDGDVHSVLGLNGSFVTVTSNKGIAVNASPYGAWSGNYYNSLYGQDSTGTGIGKRFHFPVISGGQLIIFSYQADSQVTITDSGGQVVWSGVLDAGETYSFNTAYTVYSISSTGYLSALFDWGDHAGADFAPVYYGGPLLSRGSISLLALDFYQQDTPIDVSAVIDNPGATTTTYKVTMSLIEGGTVVESHSQDVIVPAFSCSLPIEFEFSAQPAGSYALVAELHVAAELLDSESRDIPVLGDADQVKAALAAGTLTERALAELEQTEGIAIEDLTDGIKRLALDPAKWSAEKLLTTAAKAIALHYGASSEAVEAIEEAIKLFMFGVKEAFVKEPVEDVARQKAESIVTEALAGRSDEVLGQEALFINSVAGETSSWDLRMDIRTKYYETTIRSIVELRPFLTVVSIPPFVGLESFLTQHWEYSALAFVSDALKVLVVLLAVAAIAAFLAGTSLTAIVAGLSVGAVKVLAAIKAAGLVNALVVPLVLFSTAFAMIRMAETRVAPAIVDSHQQALDSLLDLIQSDHVTGVTDLATDAQVDGYQVSLRTTARNTGGRADAPLIEIYLYTIDGALIDILSSQLLLEAGQAGTLEHQLDLPAGTYRAVSVLHARGTVALEVQVTPFEVSVPQVYLNASLGAAHVSLGEAVSAIISITNTDLTSATGELALFAISSDGQNLDSWSINLPPGGSQQVSYSFVPQVEGGYVLKLRLTDSLSVLARQDLGYAVGEGVAVAINVGQETAYSPGQDVTMPITATNAGNQPTSIVLSLETLDAQDEYNTVHTTSANLSLDGGDSEVLTLTALPDAQPGTYLTRILLDDVLYDNLEFSVEAVDTLYAHIAPDAFFHNVGDTVPLTAQVADSSYVHTDADLLVTIVDPEGASHGVTMSHVDTGLYQGSFAASIAGTYVADVGISRPGYRTVPDSSSFVVGRASGLVPSTSGELFQGQTNPLTVTATTESGLPVTEATVVLSGSHRTFTAVTDQDGQARLSVQTEFGEELYHGSVRKVGYLNASFKVSVIPALDTEPPFIFFDSVFDGQSANTSPISVTGSTEIGAVLMINGEPVPVDTSGNFATSITLSEGENTLTATATDPALNSNTVNVTLYLDTAPPPLTVTSPVEGLVTKEIVVNVTGVTEPDIGVSIGEHVLQANADGSFSAWILLGLGDNSLSVTATDTAGNSTSVTRTVASIPYSIYLPCILRGH